MQWHQLDHMQTICTSLKTDNHTNTSSLKFYRLDALTDVQPTLSKHWRQRHCFTITIQCDWIQKSMASGRGMPYAHTQTDGQVKNIMSLWPQRTGGGCIITWYFKCLPLHMQSPPLQFICIWCQLKKVNLIDLAHSYLDTSFHLIALEAFEQQVQEHCDLVGRAEGGVQQLAIERHEITIGRWVTSTSTNHRHVKLTRQYKHCRNTYTCAHISGTTQVSPYQKGKTNLDFTETRDSQWQWHQLGHMQVCTSLQTHNHASTPPLSFYRPDALPAIQPTASQHWRQQEVLVIKTDFDNPAAAAAIIRPHCNA